MRRLVVLTALTAAPAMLAAAADTVLNTKVGPVNVALLIPAETSGPLRGLYVHAAHYTLRTHDRWAESARSISFGHVGLNIDLKLNNRPKKLRKGLDEGLAQFAARTGRAELPHLPMIGVGHSAGGMVVPVLMRTPERTITTCVSCGWITDPAKLPENALHVPMLFTLGAIPDAFKMLPTIGTRYLPARAKGMPWGLAVQWGCAHDFANSATLFIPWSESIARLRLPKNTPAPGKPVTLRPIDRTAGWLGDRSNEKTHFAPIAPTGEFKGEKSKAVWLPDRTVAFVWRAMQSNDPPVVLHAAAADGSATLPKANPKTERGMTVGPGIAMKLSVTAREGTQLAEVTYFDGDRPLGKATSAPWEMVWRGAAAGAHAISAIWTDAAGQKNTTNPALVIVRRSPAGTK